MEGGLKNTQRERESESLERGTSREKKNQRVGWNWA